jgi:hypothetical protein
VWLAHALSGREKDVAPSIVAVARGPPPDPAATVAPLEDAETLARQGRFGEAIHVLLLRLLEELARRTTAPIPASLTSREIVERVAVPDAARKPLAALVHAVEVSHFGSDVPDRGDYDLCLGRYREFATAYVGATA